MLIKSVGLLAALAGIIFVASLLFAAPAGAQSGGCTGSYADATALDSDGDGVSDSDEIQTGTDECDPSSTPELVCGEYVTPYDSSSFDADNDGYSDAMEKAAGSDPCDATSVVSSVTTQPPVDEPAASVTNAPAAPLLALTGPSAFTYLIGSGLLLVALGSASLVVGRRKEI